MLRKIEHTAFARRSYGDIAWLLDRHFDEIIEYVASAAVDRSAAIHAASETPIPGFDEGHPIDLTTGPLVLDDHHATVRFSWEGNATKRLLVNADVRLDIRPLIARGPGATTEITLRADYIPPTAHRRSPEAVLFGRRLVKAALKELLDVLVVRLEEFEERAINV